MAINIKSQASIQLKNFNDIFSASSSEGEKDVITRIPLNKLHTFRDHPFRVEMDEAMEELCHSIKENGDVNEPILVRPHPEIEGEYEIISGHRRTFACNELKITEISAIIRELDDYTATKFMVAGNMHRPKIYPSDKGRAYAMQMESLKKAKKEGKIKTDKRTDEVLADEVGETRANVQFYIRITYLIKEFQDLCDSGELAISSAQPLSQLPKEIQIEVYEAWEQYCKPKLKAEALKELYNLYKEFGEVSQNDIQVALGILQRVKPKAKKVTFSEKTLSKYFNDDYSAEQIEEIIENLLDRWAEENGASVSGHSE